MVSFLGTPSVLGVAKRFVRRLHHHASARHHNSPREINIDSVGTVRMLLAAYMISSQPERALEVPFGAAERVLIEISARLVGRLERVARCVVDSRSFRGVPAELTSDFLSLLDEYIKRFWEWQVPDKARIVQRIQTDLAELEDSLARSRVQAPISIEKIAELEGLVKQQRDKLVNVAGRKGLEKYNEGRREDIAKAFQACLDITAGPRLSDEDLAHELLLNPSFQLLDPGTLKQGGDHGNQAIQVLFTSSSSSFKRFNLFFG